MPGIFFKPETHVPNAPCPGRTRWVDFFIRLGSLEIFTSASNSFILITLANDCFAYKIFPEP
jgi:hypothetical protein